MPEVVLWTFEATAQMRAEPGTRVLDVHAWPEPPGAAMLACTYRGDPYWYGWLDGVRVGDDAALPAGYYLIPRAT